MYVVQIVINNTKFGNERRSFSVLLQRSQASWIQQCFASPCKALAKTMYGCRSEYPSLKLANAINTVVYISDTHNQSPEIPEGDLLIYAGDLSQGGIRQQIQRTVDWLKDLSHHFKVIIAGNHELLLDPQKGFPHSDRTSLNWHDLIYLEDSSTSLQFKGRRVLNLYGSLWTRKHGKWAFEYPRGVDKWTHTAPERTDILITHMPSFAHPDLDGLEDEQLLREVRRARPELHVFGHIQAGYGKDELHHDSFEEIYKAVMRSDADLWGVLKMAFYAALVCAVVKKTRCYRRTLLVNAATVGGFRSEDLREPLIVQV